MCLRHTYVWTNFVYELQQKVIIAIVKGVCVGGGCWSTEDNSETTFSYFSTEMFAVSPHEG